MCLDCDRYDLCESCENIEIVLNTHFNGTLFLFGPNSLEGKHLFAKVREASKFSQLHLNLYKRVAESTGKFWVVTV